jgi:hypothetical protein
MNAHPILKRLALPAAILLLTACADQTTAPAADTLLVAGTEGPLSASASAAQHTQADVFTHPSQGPSVQVPDATATLVSNDNGARATFTTRGLAPGHAHTLWWVVINAPENCAASPCTAADVLFNDEVVQSNVAYGGGNVVGGSGKATFAAHFSTGPVPGGWFGSEFTNPRGAEIHLIIMDHGPAIPELVSNQIRTLRGGCTDESVPAAFPPVAHADGVPGPNTCRLVQLAIFEQ